MSRIAIIEYHTGPIKVNVYGADATDESMIEQAFLPSAVHLIKQITLCTEDKTIVNESGLVTWLKATKRLT